MTKSAHAVLSNRLGLSGAKSELYSQAPLLSRTHQFFMPVYFSKKKNKALGIIKLVKFPRTRPVPRTCLCGTRAQQLPPLQNRANTATALVGNNVKCILC